MPSSRSRRQWDKAAKALGLELCAFNHQPLPIPSPPHRCPPRSLASASAWCRQSFYLKTGTTHYQTQNLVLLSRRPAGGARGPAWCSALLQSIPGLRSWGAPDSSLSFLFSSYTQGVSVGWGGVKAHSLELP